MVQFRIRAWAAAVVGAAMLIAPAVAADLPGVSQPWQSPTRVSSAWQGFYVGVHGGYSWARFDSTLNVPASVFSVEESSLSGGLFAGFNMQLAPQFVAGVEGDFTLWNPNGSALIAGSTYQADSDLQGTIRARLGMTFENLLVFATGGVAFADATFKGPFGSTSQTQIGWVLGGGVEAKVTEQVFARAEYLYTSFGSDDYALGPVQRINGDLDTHTLRVGVGVRF